MKKKIFAKTASLLMALCMLIGAFGTVSAYAMEAPSDLTSEAQLVKSSTYVPYGTAVTYHSGVFRDSTYLPGVTVSSDARVHRMIFRFRFHRAATDNGIGDVVLNVKVTRSNGASYTYTSSNVGYSTIDWQIVGVPVSPGETVSVWVDASTAPGVTSNGNFRSIDIVSSEVYCD